MRLEPRERQEIWLDLVQKARAVGSSSLSSLSIHQGHLCSSHFLAAVNIAAVTLCMPMFVQDSAFLSFGFFPAVLLASSHSASIFYFLGELYLSLESQASDVV